MNSCLLPFLFTRSTRGIISTPCPIIRSFHHSSRLSAHHLLMPALSPTMTEGSIVKWHIDQGVHFNAGDVLFEVETDKAQLEVDAQDDGVLAKILIPAGTKGVTVNSVIAIVAEEGEDISSINLNALSKPVDNTLPSSSSSTSTLPTPESIHYDKSNVNSNSKSNIMTSTLTNTKPRHPHIAPAVSHLISLYNLDNTIVSKIPASGPQNRLLKGDVLTYVRNNKLLPRKVIHLPPSLSSSQVNSIPTIDTNNKFTPIIMDIPLSYDKEDVTRKAIMALSQSSDIMTKLLIDGTPIMKPSTTSSSTSNHDSEIHIHIDGIHHIPRPLPSFSLKTKQQELDFYQYLSGSSIFNNNNNNNKLTTTTTTTTTTSRNKKSSQDLIDYLGGIPHTDDTRYQSILRVHINKVIGLSSTKDIDLVVKDIRNVLELAL